MNWVVTRGGDWTGWELCAEEQHPDATTTNTVFLCVCGVCDCVCFLREKKFTWTISLRANTCADISRNIRTWAATNKYTGTFEFGAEHHNSATKKKRLHTHVDVDVRSSAFIIQMIGYHYARLHGAIKYIHTHAELPHIVNIYLFLRVACEREYTPALRRVCLCCFSSVRVSSYDRQNIINERASKIGTTNQNQTL